MIVNDLSPILRWTTYYHKSTCWTLLKNRIKNICIFHYFSAKKQNNYIFNKLSNIYFFLTLRFCTKKIFYNIITIIIIKITKSLDFQMPLSHRIWTWLKKSICERPLKCHNLTKCHGQEAHRKPQSLQFYIIVEGFWRKWIQSK